MCNSILGYSVITDYSPWLYVATTWGIPWELGQIKAIDAASLESPGRYISHAGSVVDQGGTWHTWGFVFDSLVSD